MACSVVRSGSHSCRTLARAGGEAEARKDAAQLAEPAVPMVRLVWPDDDATAKLNALLASLAVTLVKADRAVFNCARVCTVPCRCRTRSAATSAIDRNGQRVARLDAGIVMQQREQACRVYDVVGAVGRGHAKGQGQRVCINREVGGCAVGGEHQIRAVVGRGHGAAKSARPVDRALDIGQRLACRYRDRVRKRAASRDQQIAAGGRGGGAGQVDRPGRCTDRFKISVRNGAGDVDCTVGGGARRGGLLRLLRRREGLFEQAGDQVRPLLAALRVCWA